MKGAMRALAEFLGRRRRWVLGAWVTIVVLALPLASKQTDHLTGGGCDVAIALDATLVRLVLVPAAMKLMGGWNWWMPSWLDRVVPDLSFEGGEREPEPETA